jgi:SAM-dependent methyltransferase
MPVWPKIEFDPVKLFELDVRDILQQDPYYVRLTMESSYPELGDDLFIGLLDAPDVAGYLSEVCPEKAQWLAEGIERVGAPTAERIREAQTKLVTASWPWNLGMTKAPALWDSLPWGFWDPSAIYDRVDIEGKVILDVGAGTGAVSLRCAPLAHLVWALEPVASLRRYIERRMAAAGLENVRTLDGVLAQVPLADGAVDVSIIANGSFGWETAQELEELERVTRPGGAILMLAPTSPRNEEELRQIREAGGYEAFDFELPTMGPMPAFVKHLS